MCIKEQIVIKVVAYSLRPLYYNKVICAICRVFDKFRQISTNIQKVYLDYTKMFKGENQMAKRLVSRFLVLLMLLMQLSGGMVFASDASPSIPEQGIVLVEEPTSSPEGTDTPTEEIETNPGDTELPAEDVVTAPDDSEIPTEEAVTEAPEVQNGAETPVGNAEKVTEEPVVILETAAAIDLDTTITVTEDEMKAAGMDAVSSFFVVKYVDGSQEIRRIDSKKVAVVSEAGQTPLRINALIKTYNQKPDVEYAEPVSIYKTNGIEADYIPNDPEYLAGNLWGVLKTNTNKVYGRIPTTSLEEVVVAVIDTGVDYSHPDLENSIYKTFGTVKGYDLVNNDADPMDDYGHGTHVAGTIAAESNNGIGIVGIAAGVKIMPIKVLDASGNGYDTTVAAGIRWAADHGANIINMSLGGPGGSQVMQDAVNYAVAKGITVIASSGNDANNSAGRRAGVGYPAACDNVIAVGAVELKADGKCWISYFSNSGPELDVVAPGVSIMSSIPGGGYQSWAGTSMAAPHVAALAALLKAQDDSRTPAKIESLIEAETNSNFDHDTVYGKNDKVEAEVYGAGLIDCFAALGLSAGSDDTWLKSITLAGYDFGFNPKVTDYSIEATSNTVEISATGYTDTQSAWISANGSDFVAMELGEKYKVDLIYGSNEIIVRSFSEDNAFYRDYKIQMLKKYQSNALAALSISKGILSPLFSPDIMEYKTNVSFGTKQVDIIASAAYTDAELTINGADVASNDGFKLDLLEGLNTLVIGVRDALNDLREYTVEITRESNPWNDEGLPVNQFRAEYYDDRSPNTVVYSEVVDRACLNYCWGEFHNIDSENFKGVWAGEFTFDKDTVKTLQVAQSWAKTTVLVDGEVVISETNTKISMPYTFEKGSHIVRVIHESNYFSTGFAFTMNDPARVWEKGMIEGKLNSLMDNNTVIYHAGVYDSVNFYQNTDVTVLPTDKSVILFLTSYCPVDWRLKNPDKVNIKAIVYSGHEPGSEVTGAGDAFVMESRELGYIDNFKFENLKGYAPKEVAGFTFNHDGNSLAVPEHMTPAVRRYNTVDKIVNVLPDFVLDKGNCPTLTLAEEFGGQFNGGSHFELNLENADWAVGADAELEKLVPDVTTGSITYNISFRRQFGRMMVDLSFLNKTGEAADIKIPLLAKVQLGKAWITINPQDSLITAPSRLEFAVGTSDLGQTVTVSSPVKFDATGYADIKDIVINENGPYAIGSGKQIKVEIQNPAYAFEQGHIGDSIQYSGGFTGLVDIDSSFFNNSSMTLTTPVLRSSSQGGMVIHGLRIKGTPGAVLDKLMLKISGDALNKEHTLNVAYGESAASEAKPSTGGGGGGGGGGGAKVIVKVNEATTANLDEFTVNLEPNTATSEFELNVNKVTYSTSPFGSGNRQVSGVYNLTSNSDNPLQKNMEIRFQLKKKSFDPKTEAITIYYLDPKSNKWAVLKDVETDSANGTLRAETKLFTEFAVIASSQALIAEEPVALGTAAITLKDIGGHWAEANIQKLIAKKAVSGNPDGTFMPDKQITRAEFITMLVKALELKGTTDKTFSDLNGHWAAESVKTAISNGVLSGFEDGTIRPNDLITREQMASMIHKAAKLQVGSPDKRPVDEHLISSWAKESVLSAMKAGVISGYADNTFRPASLATKAEAVTIIARCMK